MKLLLQREDTMIPHSVSRWAATNLLWLTCLFNGLTGGSFSYPFCARVYRNATDHPDSLWFDLLMVIDFIFPEDDHCERAYRWAAARGLI